MISFGQLHMSLNCSSGLFFIPSYLIIKGRKRFCRRRTVSSSCQFTRFRKRRQSVIFTQDRQIYLQGLSILPRRCCSISNVCRLFVYYIWATIRRRIFCMPLCFFIDEDIAKKYEQEREPFALVIGQKRKCDAQELKFVLRLLWTLSEGNCRRFVYLILQ